MSIKSIGFSSDTSLLGVGFGNTLCVYEPETLQLKCALSAPTGFDGSVNKLSISLPSDKKKSNLTEKRQHFLEKRKKLLSAIRSMLESDDVNIVKKINDKKSTKATNTSRTPVQTSELGVDEQQMLFDQILAFNSINLFQKIHIYDKLNLHGRAPLKYRQAFADYCERSDVKSNNADLCYRLMHVSPRYKFKYAHKYHQYKSHCQKLKETKSAFDRVINFEQHKPTPKLPNGNVKWEDDENTVDEQLIKSFHKETIRINHVAFCAGEFSHLVIVCTENRLLIWNLLTLRLQSSYKIAVDKICIDLYTSLVAVTTKNDGLYVFLPNTPIPLYQHKDLPKIKGIAWIPRHFPKPHSLTIDWQASTELYFLSERQVFTVILDLNCVKY